VSIEVTSAPENMSLGYLEGRVSIAVVVRA
jgi:hypothetical protein